MPSRKKRLKKGIESLEKQIEIHKEKKKMAEEEKKLELVDYYKKEILSIKETKRKKEELLKKAK